MNLCLVKHNSIYVHSINDNAYMYVWNVRFIQSTVDMFAYLLYRVIYWTGWCHCVPFRDTGLVGNSKVDTWQFQLYICFCFYANLLRYLDFKAKSAKHSLLQMYVVGDSIIRQCRVPRTDGRVATKSTTCCLWRLVFKNCHMKDLLGSLVLFYVRYGSTTLSTFTVGLLTHSHLDSKAGKHLRSCTRRICQCSFM